VNLAARLQGQAADGQIVLSDALARQAALAPERLESLGARRLKNVQDPVECFRLV
jgi:class 3 adenylate cyclase